VRKIKAVEEEGRRKLMAAFRSELEKFEYVEFPSLDQMEAGKPVGAVLPMSEEAQDDLRDSFELIDFLLHQDEITWN
jgi:hypothetical protein